MTEFKVSSTEQYEQHETGDAWRLRFAWITNHHKRHSMAHRFPELFSRNIVNAYHVLQSI